MLSEHYFLLPSTIEPFYLELNTTLLERLQNLNAKSKAKTSGKGWLLPLTHIAYFLEGATAGKLKDAVTQTDAQSIICSGKGF